MEDCFFEVVLYDAKHWWNISDMFNPLPRQGLGIRYDQDHYMVWEHEKIRKVKASKIEKRKTWSEKKPVLCKGKLVGSIWLEHCITYKQKFGTGKEFLQKYVSVVSGVKSGKRDQGHRSTDWHLR